MKKLKYLFFLLLFIPFNTFAMDVPITVSEGQWYNNSAQLVYTGSATSRTIGTENFFQFSGQNNYAQFLNFSVYYPESSNDLIKSKNWDISFTVLSYGDFVIKLGSSSCFVTSSVSAVNYLNNQTTGDLDINDADSYYYKTIFCPNASIQNTPTPFRMYRTFSSNNFAVNRLIVNKIWSFSETSNSNQEITTAITNQTNSINNSINNVNDNITSEDTLTSSETSDTIDSFSENVASDTPITDLLTMPLTLINAYIGGMNSSCTPYNFGSLLGTNLVMPCINLQQRLGNNVWSIIDVLFSIFMIFNISKLFIGAFNKFTTLKDDFSNMYTNDYEPKHGGDD